MNSVWLPRITTLLLAALLAVICVFWFTKLAAGVPQGAARTLTPDTSLSEAPPRDLTNLFGGAALATDSSIKLLGLIAERDGGGRALISLNDGPPKSYAVGKDIAPGLVLKQLEARAALIERNGQPVRVALPPPSATIAGAINAAAPRAMPQTLPPGGVMPVLPGSQVPSQLVPVQSNPAPEGKERDPAAPQPG
jgi:general secretion pathway protein C